MQSHVSRDKVLGQQPLPGPARSPTAALLMPSSSSTRPRPAQAPPAPMLPTKGPESVSGHSEMRALAEFKRGQSSAHRLSRGTTAATLPFQWACTTGGPFREAIMTQDATVHGEDHGASLYVLFQPQDTRSRGRQAGGAGSRTEDGRLAH